MNLSSMERKRKLWKTCRNCDLQFYGKESYSSHAKLCISMNDTHDKTPLTQGRLVSCYFRPRPKRRKIGSASPRKEEVGSVHRKAVRKRLRQEPCGAQAWEEMVVNKCRLPRTGVNPVVVPERFPRVSSISVESTKLPVPMSLKGHPPSEKRQQEVHPDRSILGSLSMNSELREGRERRGVEKKARLFRRRKGKGVNYVCQPCGETLVSWQAIRKHLLSSEHLLCASKHRRKQLARQNGKKNNQQMWKIISNSPQKVKVVPQTNASPPEASSLPNAEVPQAERGRGTFRSTPSSLVLSKEAPAPGTSSSRSGGSLVRVDYEKKSAKRSSEGKEAVGVSDRRLAEVLGTLLPYVDLGHRCDSAEFLRDFESSCVLRSKTRDVSFSVVSLRELVEHRERHLVRKCRNCGYSAPRSEASGARRGRKRSMVRYDYKKVEKTEGVVCSVWSILDGSGEAGAVPDAGGSCGTLVRSSRRHSEWLDVERLTEILFSMMDRDSLCTCHGKTRTSKLKEEVPKGIV